MRILALDYGDKTVGLAISDENLKIAQPLFTVARKNPIDVKDTIRQIVQVVDEKNVGRIVIGMPLNMNGSEGERAQKTKWFKKKLSKSVSIEIVLWDERLSTVSADGFLVQGQVKKQDRKKYLDKVAASIILESYLGYLNN